MIKILIGGSPCTYWSVAQKKNREVEAEGLGWELFKNYLIAKEKFKPDFFLYENNKSAAQAIKDQISRELGVELMHINSALVSAQNRQRFYAFNWSVEQPEDRGILLRDILESSALYTEKGYELRQPAPLNMTAEGKAQCIRASCYTFGGGLLGEGAKGITVFPAEFAIAGLSRPVGGFLTLACVIAAMQYFLSKSKNKQTEKKEAVEK